jgi:hypothetical protein
MIDLLVKALTDPPWTVCTGGLPASASSGAKVPA